MIHFSPIWHHIEDRAHTRLYDGSPASDADISSEDWSALRDARRDATLCPDCQDKVNPRDVRLDLYGYGRMSTAHLYSVPVLAAFDSSVPYGGVREDCIETDHRVILIIDE